MAEFIEICHKLDELVKQYFNILDELHDERICLENALKQGYFNLSKARYSMGNKAVGSVQYNSKSMKALATFCVNEDNEEYFELIRKKPQNKSSKKPVSVNVMQNVDSPPSKETTVRRRKGQDNKDADNTTSRLQELTINSDDKLLESDDSVIDAEVVSDPIRWFGILVPAALRHGQSDFTQAITSCCRIANLQKQVLRTKAEYQALYSKKQELIQEKNDVTNTLSNATEEHSEISSS